MTCCTPPRVRTAGNPTQVRTAGEATRVRTAGNPVRVTTCEPITVDLSARYLAIDGVILMLDGAWLTLNYPGA